jgi:hypothetical protein
MGVQFSVQDEGGGFGGIDPFKLPIGSLKTRANDSAG